MNEPTVPPASVADTQRDATTAHQPASVRGKCPRCGGIPTNNRHYPSGYGDYPEPVNRYYCAPCDTEWWV